MNRQIDEMWIRAIIKEACSKLKNYGPSTWSGLQQSLVIRWSDRLQRTIAYCDVSNCKIVFSTSYWNIMTMNERRLTVIHEICHWFTWAFDNTCLHNKEWKYYMRLMGVESPSRYTIVSKTFLTRLDVPMPSIIFDPSEPAKKQIVVSAHIGGEHFKFEYPKVKEAEAYAKRDELLEAEAQFYQKGQTGFGALKIKKSNIVNKDQKTLNSNKETEMKRTKTRSKVGTKKKVEKLDVPKGQKCCSTKKCPYGQIQPSVNFAINNNRKDGLHGRCKQCESDYQRARRETAGQSKTKKTVKKVAPKKSASKKVKKAVKKTTSKKKASKKVKRGGLLRPAK